MQKKNNKQGSTLLFTMLIFTVFLIFAAALSSLAQRSFSQTASDIDQQRAYFTAKSTAETFVSQLNGDVLDEMLTQLFEDGQTITGEWTDFDDYSQYRYTLKRESKNDLDTSSIATILLTAQGRANGKIESISAAIQATMRFNNFHDSKRVVMVNQCRVATESTANFWINATSTKIKPAAKPTPPAPDKEDPDKKGEDVIAQTKGNDIVFEEEDDPADKVTLVYRNIKEPKITGSVDANIYLEPAAFSKAIVGSQNANEVVINGTIYCKGNLVIKNAIVNGDVHVDGTITFEKESRVNGTAYTNNPVDAGKVNSFQPLNSAVFDEFNKIEPLLTEKLAVDTTSVIVEKTFEPLVKINASSNQEMFFELANPNTTSLQINVEDKTSVSPEVKALVLFAKKLPAKIEVISKIQNYQIYIYVDDPAPVMTNQISSNLVAMENIHLIFANPVTIMANINASVYAEKIIFKASDLQINGSVQACEFENSQLVNSVGLQRKYYDTTFLPKLDKMQKYIYFDFIAYRS